MAASRRARREKKKVSTKARLYRSISVILIVIGLGILSYTGFQWLSVHYHQTRLRDSFTATAGFRNIFEQGPEVIKISEFKPMRLVIPAIDVDLMVVGDVDTYDPDLIGNKPWNFSDADYRKWLNDLKPLLDKGPVYYQLSDLPSSEKGNVVIAGHRAGHWNFFRYLDELEEGDEIYLEVDGYRFTYLVEKVVQVNNDDWTMFLTTEEPSITLQTCTPLGVPTPPLPLERAGRSA